MTYRLLSRREIFPAACAALLAGCSLLPDPPAPQIYRLRPAADDPPSSPSLRAQLAIDMPSAPQNLDTDRIALTIGGTRFDYYADSTWTDRVPALLQNLLVEAFEADGRITDVERDAGGLTQGYLLETDIRDLQARYDTSAEAPPTVVVRFELRLVRMPGLTTTGHILITEQASATRNRLDSVVHAFDAAVGGALSQSVAWATGAISRS